MMVGTAPTVVEALAVLSVEEKAALTSGGSFFATKAAAGRREIVLSDGPHGVRASSGGAGDHLGISPSLPATCFPPGAGLAQSWDPDLARELGAALAREARHRGVSVLLGPAVNVRRDPRCGRNFEYHSEDPVLAGDLGAAWVQGLQWEGVGASVKHFAANNAEFDRMRSNSSVDPRALREIYLKVFERIVKQAHPWTVMCSYNRINGVYASENEWLLKDVLRGEWGFDGVVVSDWGAVQDRVAALRGGTDLAMPAPPAESDAALAAAVTAGQVSREELDQAAGNVLRLLDRAAAGPEVTPVDFDDHQELARRAAARSIVLLKNADSVLPLDPSSRIAVIGAYAEVPRFQGGGSSHVTPTQVDSPLTCLQSLASEVTYAQGYPSGPADDAAMLRSEAAVAAGAADVAVVFLALPERDESEGYDRTSVSLPAAQLALLRAVVERQARIVAVVSHGGMVLMGEVAEHAMAILDTGLLGQGGGAALADTLLGRVNPSGKLAETIPIRLEDSPSYLNFPGEQSQVLYGESIYVGYRWYDARNLPVAYPFGHGLSYTTFGYGELAVTATADELAAAVTVTNTGERAGREIVQFYLSKLGSSVRRPPRELKAFGSVDLQPGESGEVAVLVPRDDLAYWEDRAGRWVVEGGAYEVTAAASSRDLRATATVEIAGDEVILPISRVSTMREVMTHPVAGPMLQRLSDSRTTQAHQAGDALGTDLHELGMSMTLGTAMQMGRGMTDEQVEQFIVAANGGAPTS